MADGVRPSMADGELGSHVRRSLPSIFDSMRFNAHLWCR